MADYPNSVKNFLTLNDGVDRIVAAHPNDRGGEITAIETLLGALGSIQSNSESLKNLLIDFNKSVHVEYLTAATLTLKAGEIAIPDASGNVRWRRNTSDLTVTWANIDIGAEANDTYYVYAVADTAGTGFTAKVSLSASLPYEGVFYRKIGSFINSAGDISENSVANEDPMTYPNAVKASTYDSGWFSVASDTAYAKTHNLGTIKFLYMIYWSASSNGANAESAIDTSGGGSMDSGMQLQAITTTTFSLRTGADSVHGTFVAGTTTSRTSGYARIVLVALE